MNEWKNVALFWGKNYPKNLLDKVRLLHYSNYRKQNKQEQNLKKKSFHGHLEERNVLVQDQKYWWLGFGLSILLKYNYQFKHYLVGLLLKTQIKNPLLCYIEIVFLPLILDFLLVPANLGHHDLPKKIQNNRFTIDCICRCYFVGTFHLKFDAHLILL